MPRQSTTAKAQASTGVGGAYLNVSKIPVGKEIRIALLPADDGFQEYIEGFCCWGQSKENPKDRKPFRFETEPTREDIEAKMNQKGYTRGTNDRTGQLEDVKYFLTYAVWDYDASEVKVMEISQKSIINGLNDIEAKEDDYPNLTEIDLTIGREDKSYKVTPVPRRRGTQAQITEAWNECAENEFDLNRLFEMGNPFMAERS